MTFISVQWIHMIFLEGSTSQEPLLCTSALDNSAIIQPSVPFSFYAHPFMIFQCSYPATLIPALLHVFTLFLPPFSVHFPAAWRTYFWTLIGRLPIKYCCFFCCNTCYSYLPQGNFKTSTYRCQIGSQHKWNQVLFFLNVPQNRASLFFFFLARDSRSI